jgi:hypothetical protein
MKSKHNTKRNTPIVLKDNLPDKRIPSHVIKPPQRHITMKTTRQGIEFSCAHYHGIYRGIPVVHDDTGVEIGDLPRGNAIVSWFLLTIVLPVGLWFLNSVLEDVSPVPSPGIMAGYLGLLSLFWGGVLYQLLRTDKLVLSQRSLEIHTMLGGVRLRKTDYEIEHITNLRLGGHGDALQFLHKRHIITWGEKLGHHAATTLLHQVSTILQFRCHSIERVIFGEVHMRNLDPLTTGHNIEVSGLAFPFVRLQQILIQTATYDLYQVEQFLTYAVNVIGRDDLKHHVDVHLYGDPEQLHPNLRNNFMTLCRHVYIHEAEQILLE